MGKKGPRGTSTQIAVRLEDDLLARVDALIPRLRTMVHEPTRSDIVRAAMVAGLPDIEAEAERVAALQVGASLQTKPHRRRGTPR